MLLTSQVVQAFRSKLDYAWMVVEQTFTRPFTEGQVSEVEYSTSTVKLKVREWTNPKHPAFQALPLQFVSQHASLSSPLCSRSGPTELALIQTDSPSV